MGLGRRCSASNEGCGWPWMPAAVGSPKGRDATTVVAARPKHSPEIDAAAWWQDLKSAPTPSNKPVASEQFRNGTLCCCASC